MSNLNGEGDPQGVFSRSAAEDEALSQGIALPREAASHVNAPSVTPPMKGRYQAPAQTRDTYVRVKKGHSLILNLLIIGPITLYITTVYYSLSKNHFWHA